MSLTFLFLALAWAISPPAPALRLQATDSASSYPTNPKTPRDGPQAVLLAAELEFLAACMDAGLAPAIAVNATAQVASSASQRAWSQVAALLVLGVPLGRAFEDAASIPGLDQLARLMRLADQSGAATASSIRRIASGLRADAADQDTARAERAGVLIALPLSLFFLPAFLVLGLVPVIIGLASTLTAL